MQREIDLTVLEPFTPQEIQSYIDYLWKSGATDVAAAVVGALKLAIPGAAAPASLPVMGGEFTDGPPAVGVTRP